MTSPCAMKGAAFHAAELSHIFDKFYRARKGDCGTAGTGLGLSVARGFVEVFGGRSTRPTAPTANGAIFTLTMPVEDKERENHGK